MYILFVASGYASIESPLLGIFEFDQAKALKNLGHKVIYVSLDLRSLRRRRRLGKYWIQKDGIEILNISIPLGRLPKKINHFIGKQALSSISGEVEKLYGRPDIVHAHFSDIGFMASVFKEKYKVPLVITEHSSHINTVNLSPKHKFYAFKAYKKADKLIAVSSALGKMIFGHFGIKCEIVHNIVDISEFSFSKKSKMPLFTFISIGNLNYNKGMDILIDAFDKVDFGSDVQLKIIGGGEEHNKLQKQIDTAGLSGQVHLLGARDRSQISKMMQESDIFVLASRSETFGVVYIEAMFTGLPVIATSCGGPEDFVNAENGLLVPVDDVNALAQALKMMFQSVDSYDRVNISTKCYQRFSPSKIANQLVSIYQKVIESN